MTIEEAEKIDSQFGWNSNQGNGRVTLPVDYCARITAYTEITTS
jgi:hypothetical protein